MPSPFPGMDPYLECPSLWPGLHVALINHLQADLNPRLLPVYFARHRDARLCRPGRGPGATTPDPGRDASRSRRGPGAAEVRPRSSKSPSRSSSRGARPGGRGGADCDQGTGDKPTPNGHRGAESDQQGSRVRRARQFRCQAARRPVVDRPLARNRSAPGRGAIAYRPVSPPTDYWIFQSRAGRCESDPAAGRSACGDRLPVVGVPLAKPDSDLPLDLRKVLDSAYDQMRIRIPN